MTVFPSALLGDCGSLGVGRFVGFDRRKPTSTDHTTVIIGNMGFVHNLRTGIIHVRIMSALKERNTNATADQDE